MNVATLLDAEPLTVTPGEETGCEVRVRNVGDTVDQFTVDVVGDTGEWASVESGAVNLMPGGEATVRIVFAPPRTPAARVGSVPFGVRVRSRERPDLSFVAEGHLEVSPFLAVDAELVPELKRGRRKARYRLAVENRGNGPVTVGVDALDPEHDQLDLTVEPAQAVVQPDTVALFLVRARPYRRFLRGEPVPHPFELELDLDGDGRDESDGDEPHVVHGTLEQQRLLPGWLLPALAVLVVLAVTAVTLWFTLLVPKVESIATEQAKQEVDEASAAASAANEAAVKANDAARQAGGGGAGGAGDATGGTGGADGDGTDGGGADGTAGADGEGEGGSAPIGFRVATGAEPVTDGSYQTFSFTAPDGKAMDIGDVVLQNPRGDVGFLRILLNDQIVLEAGLANFRDLDYHYVTPLRVKADTPVVVAVNCVTPGVGAEQCSPAVSFSGTLLG